MEAYKKHIFQVGICAFILGTLTLMMLINPGNTGIPCLVLFISFIISLGYYIRGKMKIHEASNFIITREKLYYLGFEELPHKTIGDNMIKHLGRGRILSISNLGNPNEMLIISSRDNWLEEPSHTDQFMDDCIVLHNYDYDGYITFNKLESLCKLLSDVKSYGLHYNV